MPNFSSSSTGRPWMCCFVFALLLIASCSTNRQWRYSAEPGYGPLLDTNGKCISPGSPSYVWLDRETRKPYMGFVEFDDQGEIWDHAQINSVRKAIDEKDHGKPLYLIVFIHGWNNNASDPNTEDGKNLAQFNDKILKLRAHHRKEHDGVEVMGVYIGWRGLTASRPTLFDFYSRMQGARKVGGVPATEAIYELCATARDGRDANHSKIVLVGHSFGTIVLENAINKPLAADLAQNHKPSLPADVIVLVNSAQTSLIPKQMIDVLKNHPGPLAARHNNDLPYIVSLTSDTDHATGWAFPLGVHVGRGFPTNTSVGGAYRDLPKDKDKDPRPQSWTDAHTAGWNESLHSHFMKAKGNLARSSYDGNADDGQTLFRNNMNPRQPDGSILVHGENNDYYVRRGDQPYNKTPYWIMNASKEMIDGHTDIWRWDFTAFVYSLVHLAPKS